MTENLPDYDAIEVPDVPKEDLGTHERRAALWRRMKEKKSPTRLNKARLSREFDVSRKTIYRDWDRLQEWAEGSLGEGAKLTTRAVFEGVIADLLAEDDWRAKAEAWNIVKEWNEFLGTVGAVETEPDRAEVDITSRNVDVGYRIVQQTDPDADGDTGDTTTADAEETTDYEDLGFTTAPADIDVDTPGGVE